MSNDALDQGPSSHTRGTNQHQGFAGERGNPLDRLVQLQVRSVHLGVLLESVTKPLLLLLPSSAAGKLLPQSPAVSSVDKTFPPLLQVLTGYEANGVSCLMPCLPPTGITAVHHLQNVPVLERQSDLRTRQQRVFCRVVTKQCSYIRLSWYQSGFTLNRPWSD